MELSLIHIIAILFFFQSSLFSIYLMTLRIHRNTSNRFLALFLFLLGLNIFETLLYESFYLQHPGTAYIINLTGALNAPLLYFYVKSLVYKKLRFKLLDLLHLLPFAGLIIWSVFTYHSLPAQEKLILLQTGEGINLNILAGFIILIHLQLIFYLFITFRLVRRYQALAKENFSESVRVNADWLGQLIIVFMLIVFLAFLENIVEVLTSEEVYKYTLLGIYLCYLIFINWVIYKALSQPAIFQGLDEGIILAREMQVNEGSQLKKEDAALLKRLYEFMEEEKPFLDSTLSLHGLARKLKIGSRELSILINSQLNQNFYDFVNQYRIEYAKQMLSNAQFADHTILEIMYESGFNSKSSFNTVFRKFTRQTPSQFRKQQLSTL